MISDYSFWYPGRFVYISLSESWCMIPKPPSDGPRAKTRLHCEQTEGYNVKKGARYYEFCPFCGHRTDERHEIHIEILD